MFLKRAAFGHIQSEDLYLGAILNVYSRQVKIVEYGDVFTRNELEGKKSRTLALVKPDAYPHLGKIIAEVYKMNFIIAQMRMVKMTKADAEEFFAAEKGQPYFADLVAHMTSDVVTALEVVGDSAIHAWQARIGATEETAGNPHTLRAQYGADKDVKNAIHGSKSIMDARNEIEFFFDRKWPTTAIFNNCTCAVIRPHAIKDTGDISIASCRRALRSRRFRCRRCPPSPRRSSSRYTRAFFQSTTTSWSRCARAPSSRWRSARRTPWRPSASSSAPTTRRSRATCARIPSAASLVWIVCRIPCTVRTSRRTGFWSVSTFSRCCSSKRSGFAELRLSTSGLLYRRPEAAGP